MQTCMQYRSAGHSGYSRVQMTAADSLQVRRRARRRRVGGKTRHVTRVRNRDGAPGHAPFAVACLFGRAATIPGRTSPPPPLRVHLQTERLVRITFHSFNSTQDPVGVCTNQLSRHAADATTFHHGGRYIHQLWLWAISNIIRLNFVLFHSR